MTQIFNPSHAGYFLRALLSFSLVATLLGCENSTPIPTSVLLIGGIHAILTGEASDDAATVDLKYRELCKTQAVDLIHTFAENVKTLKLDFRYDQSRASTLYSVFGYPDIIREGRHLNAGSDVYEDAEKSNNAEPFLILRVRTSGRIPYVGTFYATEILIEIVDPSSRKILAQRRTFTNGTPDHASAGDCQGKQLHRANRDFLHGAVPISP